MSTAKKPWVSCGTRTEARRHARRLVKLLGGGKHWKYSVWENLGWHFSAHALDGYLSVHQSATGKNSYYAMFSVDMPHAGDTEWTDRENKTFKDPKKAVLFQVKLVRRRVDVMFKGTKALFDLVLKMK